MKKFKNVIFKIRSGNRATLFHCTARFSDAPSWSGYMRLTGTINDELLDALVAEAINHCAAYYGTLKVHATGAEMPWNEEAQALYREERAKALEWLKQEVAE